MFNWDNTVNATHPIVKFDEFYVQLRRVRLDSEATVQRLDSITNKSSTIDYDITRYTTTRIISLLWFISAFLFCPVEL